MKFILSTLLLIFSIQTFGQKKSVSKPNILVILVDDLGYHDVSYYGTKYIQTPNIDAICSSGMRFDNFYSNAPVCSPTRASLLSGRYPERIGVPGLVRSTPSDNFAFLKKGVLFIPQYLKAANYNSAIIGKWNLGLTSPNLPNDKGFDYFHGFLDDMMNDYYTHLRNGNNFMRENKKIIDPVGHATDLFTQWAVDYIGTQKNSSNPFFLYLAYNAPHSPVQPPAEWLAKVKARENGITDNRANLVALIEHLDDGIGKVIQSLKKSGKFENTLIVFMSDNGGLISNGSNNGDLRGTKTGMYEGGIRIPACVSWPKHIAPNSSNNERVISMDIFPTIIDIIGIKNNSTIDGVSLLPLITAKTVTNKPRNLFFTMRDGGVKMGGQTTQALISGDWKILQNTPFQPYELYNLKSDPSEQQNLADIEVKKFQELQKLMVQHIKIGGRVPWQL